MKRIVTIGTSAGGVEALSAIVSRLPADLAAPVLIVMHVGNHRSILPALLAARSQLPVRHAVDGDRLSSGTVLVAPPDRHVMVERGLDGARVRLSHGPKENHTRPAIDVLFRSCAEQFGELTIGVVLTGFLDDGSTGLHAIKACGGVAIVQDPATALAPSMPQSALEAVEADYVMPLDEIADKLVELVGSLRLPPPRPLPSWVTMENAQQRQEAGAEALEQHGKATRATCPDCGGTLYTIGDQPFAHYRCHTGHAFGMHTLLHQQEAALEAAVWTAVRTLQEREHVLEQLAYRAHTTGDESAARRYTAEAAKSREQAHTLRGMTGDPALAGPAE